VLSFFGVAPKLERILWATLKKSHERSKRIASELSYGNTTLEEYPEGREAEDDEKKRAVHAIAMQAKAKPSPKKPRGPRTVGVAEVPKLTQVVDVCKCGSNMVGTVIPTCSKVKHQPIFYKECVSCTRYAETYRTIRRKKTTYYRSEGG
jgi:hypothetical protein